MRLGRLRTKGLKGLFLFPGGLDFDFRSLPDGLIAIVGPNGQGKTTVLEAPFAAFFGDFPSRPDCKLIDSVDGRDAFLDVEAHFDGRGTYRARVNVDGVKRTTDAVLELARPDGSVDRLNDGKISTFNPAVTKALPSKALLLASVFAAQNKAGSFAKLDRKERRELFAKLLGLERYEQMATAARVAAALTDKTLSAQRALRDRLQAQTTDGIEAQIHATGNALQSDLALVESEREQVGQALLDVQTEIEELRSKAARYAAATAEREQLERRRTDHQCAQARVASDRAGLETDEARDLAAIESRRDASLALCRQSLASLPTRSQLEDELTIALREIETRLEVALADRQKRIDNNQELLGRGDVIRAAAVTVAHLQASIAEHELLIADSERAGRGLQSVRDLASQQLNEAERAVAQRRQLARTAHLLADVPCGGAGEFAGCQFLQDARQADTQLAELADVDLRHAQATLEFADAARRLAGNADQRAEYRQMIQGARALLAMAQPDGALLERLNAALTRVAELEDEQAAQRRAADVAREGASVARLQAEQKAADERARIQASMDGEQTASAIATADLRARYAVKHHTLDEHAEQLVDDLATVETQIAALDRVIADNVEARDAMAAAVLREAATRRHWDDTSHRLARLEEQVKVFEQRRAEFRSARRECESLDAIVTQLESDQIEWEACARIFGREGLPVLEIDAAGPGVSALANDLLQACFGSRFVLELLTQDVKADGKGMKEVFELVVYDSDRGGEARELELLSGGEQVIVDEAVKSAIALYINHRNELPIRTCWRDETTGALDPDNALRYVQMLRRLRERGGFHQVLFVSHNLEAAALADVQLVIAGGKLEVRYPPFAAPLETEAA